MVEYARLKSQVKHNLLSDDEIVRAGMDLDTQFLTLSQQVPSSWQHKTAQGTFPARSAWPNWRARLAGRGGVDSMADGEHDAALAGDRAAA